MAKHAKKPINKPAARPAPYAKKAKVDVTFDEAPKPKAASKPAGKPKAAEKPVVKATSGDKGKGKGKVAPAASAPTAAPKITEPAPAPAPTAPSTFVVIAGSYEKLLYGLEGSYPSSPSADGTAPKPTLSPIFIFPAHLACVKAVAASPGGGKWLATGSEDEFVKVWDLRRRKEVGSLSQHTGSITSLHFPTPSHLLTTSADSTLSLFRTSDWALLKSLKGHSGRVNHVDVHPTGRVALSVGKDWTLKMWDLMRGRGAASLPLGSEPELVKFSQQGTHFAVLFPKKIQIYSLTLKLLHTLTTTSRFNTLAFALLPPVNTGSGSAESDSDAEGEETEVLCVGTEKGVVEVYRVTLGEDSDSEDDEEEDEDDDEEMEKEQKEKEGGSGAELERIGTLVGHTNRIKSISALPFIAPTASGEPRRTVLLASVSSDGLINVYDLALEGFMASEEDGPVASYDTKGTRLTCVTLAEGQDAAKGRVRAQGVQVKEVVSEDEDESEEGEDMYDNEDESGSEEGSEDEMAVEFEDEEEEEEEEEEGEYE
ncbi:hypothetical protein IAT38_002552 [Cryptococcus sp. DSM 104549]